jgi:hypothetical protein
MSNGAPPAKKQATKPAVPAGSFMLRRVFRNGDTYTCGICRRGHDSVEEANVCLEGCWQAVLARAPWMPVKRVGKLQYACIYCQRGYSKKMEATMCAENCLPNMTLTSLDGSDLSVKKIARNFVKPKTKPNVNFAFKIGGAGGYDPNADFDALHAAKVDVAKANVTVAAPVADAAPKEAPPVAEKTEKEKRDYVKKFTREGSKYVCANCQKKFFEKVDVEKCFDAHDG